MRAYSYISLKNVPAARLLLAFITGIVLQWYTALSLASILATGMIAAIFAVGFFFLPEYKKYTWQWLQGVVLLLLFTVCGALLIYENNIQHQPQWYQKTYSKGRILTATIDEPLVAKPNSYKAVAKVTVAQNNCTAQHATGSILMYFKKDSTITKRIGYGSQIVSLVIQPIQNNLAIWALSIISGTYSFKA